ncbi:MAG TPA: DUF6364 family protein [Flavobacteriales bacterium]|nr:DUF6364 family protein [Flavobacteriales bacterium]HNU56793.1 DUF6364 family protein [Flavobacteriales bacterium]
MEAKLTIRIDKATLEKAKQYAKANHTDLDRLIENYLARLVAPATTEQELDISPFVRSLASKVKSSETINAKQAYREHLYRKYR